MKLGGPIAFSLPIIAHSGSDEAFGRVSHWLQDCLAHHEDCRAAQQTFMPTRVLDIGSVSVDGKVTLVADTSHLRSPYACLSYCWGTDLRGVVTTRKANFEKHKGGISLSTLPRTVQDVARVSERLGIRYLWIDALCIIQDDQKDWVRESVQMREVYSNSQITIAAHCARSCKQGFLGPQSHGHPTWEREFRSSFGQMFAGANPEKMLIRPINTADRSFRGEFPPTPLETRGWVRIMLPFDTPPFSSLEEHSIQAYYPASIIPGMGECVPETG